MTQPPKKVKLTAMSLTVASPETTRPVLITAPAVVQFNTKPITPIKPELGTPKLN